MATVAYVVSAHGFGHAARSCAVMGAMAQMRKGLRFEIVTTVPDWFFAQSLAAEHRVHHLETDVGLVQRTSLEEDLEATVERLDQLLKPPAAALEVLISRCRSLACDAVVCDVAPLGLAAASRLQLPSALVENFTWDWLYRAYPDAPADLVRHADALGAMFRLAGCRIQTEPVCARLVDADVVAPISREPRARAADVRSRLGIPQRAVLVLLTMGGIRWDYQSLGALTKAHGTWFVVPGGDDPPRRDGNLLRLPFRSAVYHPDLVHAADLVVGKLGYSTVAEAYHGNAALAYLARPRFPESDVLERFAMSRMGAAAVTEDEFNSGRWLEHLGDMLRNPRTTETRENGAATAARLILERLSLA
jgi:hypothetical protein